MILIMVVNTLQARGAVRPGARLLHVLLQARQCDLLVCIKAEVAGFVYCEHAMLRLQTSGRETSHTAARHSGLTDGTSDPCSVDATKPGPIGRLINHGSKQANLQSKVIVV
jgi:hypothetical protein